MGIEQLINEMNLGDEEQTVTPAYKWEQDRFLRHIILGDPDEPTHHRTASLMLRKLGVEMGRQDLPIEVKRTLLNFFEGMAL